jgi:NhaA family Na+:H+ antiporter
VANDRDVSRAPARLAVRAFQDFFRLEAAGGILLLVATAAALAWANSPWAPLYRDLWHTPVSVGAGPLLLSKSLEAWVNDGLMAVFFFVVGLEIKHELLVGELASPRRAALPAFAALGGMLAPAAIYLALNLGGAGGHGWGIPMATDIAFAVGVLALLGDRVPFSLKIFLTALAIVDDLGAVLVIAVFYTSELSFTALGIAGAVFLLLVLLNAGGVRRVAPYLVLGVALWGALLTSGVHATVAGVLAALTIPANARINTGAFRARSRKLLDQFEAADPDPGTHMMSVSQHETVYGLAELIQQVQPPLARLEDALHPWVTFGIMPLFALANAGVMLDAGFLDALAHPVTLGVIGGLVLGKPIGILVFSWLAMAGGLAERPRGVSTRQMLGVGVLGGIGFTMSLFIGSLAFGESPMLENAKVGILTASAIAGMVGATVLMGGRRERARGREGGRAGVTLPAP